MSKGTKTAGFWAWPTGDIIPVTNPEKTDISIFIMGSTSVGNSTFIDIAVGRAVGHDLTAEVRPVIAPHPDKSGRRIIFVETPGFDDTSATESEILSCILLASYNGGNRWGVIYLHDDIIKSRTLGKNLAMFRNLCGDDVFKNVVFASTRCDDTGFSREPGLHGEYWKPMLNYGAGMTQFMNTHESAWAIVDLVLQKDQAEALLIQWGERRKMEEDELRRGTEEGRLEDIMNPKAGEEERQKWEEAREVAERRMPEERQEKEKKDGGERKRKRKRDRRKKMFNERLRLKEENRKMQEEIQKWEEVRQVAERKVLNERLRLGNEREKFQEERRRWEKTKQVAERNMHCDRLKLGNERREIQEERRRWEEEKKVAERNMLDKRLRLEKENRKVQEEIQKWGEARKRAEGNALDERSKLREEKRKMQEKDQRQEEMNIAERNVSVERSGSGEEKWKMQESQKWEERTKVAEQNVFDERSRLQEERQGFQEERRKWEEEKEKKEEQRQRVVIEEQRKKSATVIPDTDLRSSDIIILLMGPSGVGKSTFINTAAVGKEVTEVGDGLNSCTSTIHLVAFPNHNDLVRRIVLVDTPGCNDTHTEDLVMLERTATRLRQWSDKGVEVAGIICLFEISQSRAQELERSIRLIGQLYDDDAVKNTILVTTKWSEVLPGTGRIREEQLSKTYPNTQARFTKTYESAWAIVDIILQKDPATHLQIKSLDRQNPKIKRSRTLLFGKRHVIDRAEVKAKAVAHANAATKTGRQ